MSTARRRRVAAQPRGILATLSAIARELDVARETVRVRLQAADVRPIARKGAHELYRVGEAFRACADLVVARAAGADEFDPDKLNPFERQAHYKAESERLRVAQMAGELVSRADAEDVFASSMKLVAHALATLPDTIERDVGASPLVLEKVELRIDALREEIYHSVVAYCGEEELEDADDEEPGQPGDASGSAATTPRAARPSARAARGGRAERDRGSR